LYLVQLIDVTPANLGGGSDLLQLLVLWLRLLRPVDVRMRRRKLEGEARLKVFVERFLPRAVEVGAHVAQKKIAN
jgi:hypothetical protein